MLIELSPLRIRRVTGGNLFRVALEELGDAEQWDRIADLNGLSDPWLVGAYDLQIPRPLTKLSAAVAGFQ